MKHAQKARQSDFHCLYLSIATDDSEIGCDYIICEQIAMFTNKAPGTPNLMARNPQ